MNKQFIEVPLPVNCGLFRKTLHQIAGTLLLPFYLILAILNKAPGAYLHIKLSLVAIRLFFQKRIPLNTCYKLIYFPMDSTRYFEFHEVLYTLKEFSFQTYLDMSSPRIIPLLIMKQNPSVSANLINPDNRDLQETERLVHAFDLTDRCVLTNKQISGLKFEDESFDLITSISVIEHIPDDQSAIKQIWPLLRIGGRLILSLPCMVRPLEQYISYNHYEILTPGSDGYTFWQRYYDEQRLNSSIFNTTGAPNKMIVYGEKRNGYFFRNASSKRLLGPLYPYWRESYMMAKEYRYFNKIADLPGEGVVMMEFIKHD